MTWPRKCEKCGKENVGEIHLCDPDHFDHRFDGMAFSVGVSPTVDLHADCKAKLAKAREALDKISSYKSGGFIAPSDDDKRERHEMLHIARACDLLYLLGIHTCKKRNTALF